MTNRFICIHGHFYQPPRENPWLEEIETQDSARPYHDWNDRIAAECYARNAAARILDDQARIARITNNYSRMSFNFGPTLLRWLEAHRPGVYESILAADRISRERFSGHGAALAQAYNHMILPLANTKDRITQIRWGIRDFEHRFGRSPEGMWLPEAAVDLETLSLMADMGLAFTVLSPYQAARARPEGADDWIDVSGGALSPRRPYLQRLAGGLNIAVFFYDGPISSDVAFGSLLKNGEDLANRLMGAFEEEGEEQQLVHIATDGETFGHHHRFADMALAYALEKIDANESVRLTNYGEFLAAHPPGWEVEIVENTAWSCAHGVERWKSDCGCNTGRSENWHQGWRGPLRNALDWLRDTLAEGYAAVAGEWSPGPWEVRNDYIDVILDRSAENVARFLDRHMDPAADDDARVRALKLLEMQRHCMLMYTSCGWFFDELSGIETVQVIQYAGRAVQLAGDLFAKDVEGPFLEKLAAAESNIPAHGNGRRIYEKWVKPSRVDLKKAAVHYAISSLFEDYAERVSIFCYTLENLENRGAEIGWTKIAVGRVRVTSRITAESGLFQYAAFHLGDHSISCGVKPSAENGFDRMAEEVLGIFDRNDFPGVFQSFGRHFQDSLFSITSLFRDEQRKVLTTILESTTADILSMYRRIYDSNVNLMRFIMDTSTPVPRELYIAGEIVINTDLNTEFSRKALDQEAIRGLIEEADRSGIDLDAESLEFALRANLERQAAELKTHPTILHRLEAMLEGVLLAFELPFHVQLHEIRTLVYQMGQEQLPRQRKKATGAGAARKWVEVFLKLAEILKIRMN